MEKLKIGIIGCGGIANGKHLPALQQLHDEVELTAFCDIVPERAEKAARTYGAPGAKVYTDYRELLRDPAINNVRVLTPNRLHAEISIAALEAGKHVLCEKPMAISYVEAQAMIRAARRAGKLLTVGYQHKLDPDVIYARREAQSGALGEMYFAKANVIRRRGVPTWGVFTQRSEQGGGALIDIGTHALDIALYLMNNYRPRIALGTTYDKLKSRPDGNPFGPWDPAKFDVEEAAFGQVIMENGATILLEATWALNTTDTAGIRYMICGTDGGVDNYGGKFKVNAVRHGRLTVTEPDLRAGGVAFFDGQAESPTVAEQRVFLDAIRGKGALVTTPESAAVVTQILEGLYISARTGQPYEFTNQEEI